MNILLISGTFPPRRYGGVTRISYITAKKLQGKGHKVTVYTTDLGNTPHSRLNIQNTVVLDGVTVYYFKNISNILAFKHHIFLPLGMIQIMRRSIKCYDVVHINGFRELHNVAVSYYATKNHVPYVLQAHGSLPRVMNKRRLKWIYDVLFGYRLLKNASRVIALNHSEAEQYRAMGVPEEKIAIIPNGIDLSEYVNLPPEGAFRRTFNIPENMKIILYLGRVHKTKGIDLLIRAYAHLRNKMRCKDVFLVIAGPDDGYLGEARALANSLGLCGSIIFTGFISNEDKLKALVDAEVFVTPSFYGFPMTFLEACAVGVPIVTTNLGETLEWINENVGYITQPTPQNLAEAIHRIVSDDRLRRKFSENCTKIVKSEFSIEKVVEKLEKLYEEVVEK
jgi:glycosyltransferase involved in cell wall biosynthesis